jgi:tellurite resistance protein
MDMKGASTMNERPWAASTEHVGFAWFAMVMGLCGLSLAWARAADLLGTVALQVSKGLGWLAGGVLLLLLWATVWRCVHFAQAVLVDLRHPVRQVFVAAVPSSLVLLATVWVTHRGYSLWADALWMLGASGLLLITVAVMWRWLQHGLSPEHFWQGMTPAVFIPVVGNVLPALAGVTLGHPVWAAAQYGVAALLWPVALVLVLVRIGVVGLWPARMLPTTFITMAPPSVLALSGQQLGVPEVMMHMLWGLALFFSLVSLTMLRRCLQQPFGMPFWGMSFPLAASAALSVHLAVSQGMGQLAALGWLLTVSGAIGVLLLATCRDGLQGRLLVPEPPVQLAARSSEAP